MMMDYPSFNQETLESILVSSSGSAKASSMVSHHIEKKPRPADQQALKCPRCDSTNTKFCYYNNYSLSQPRYFCKSCRRYWTKGGTLRNVPVGGGCRKNKRVSSSNSSSKRTAIVAHQEPAIPRLSYDSNDVALAIARFQKQHHSSSSSFQGYDFGIWGNPNPSLSPNQNQNFLFGDSLGIGDTHHQNLFYGQMGMENGEARITPFEGYALNNGAGTVAGAAVKQEICKEGTEGSRILWGFPFGGDGGGDFGIGGWHGVVNSPLM